MPLQAWITSAVTIAALVALIAEWAAPEVVLLGAVTLLMVLGILEPAEALGSFGSDALLSVAALFVVAAAVRRTGILASLAESLFGRGHGGEPLLRVMLPPAAISAFLNNTPIVAMFTPAVLDWCKRHSVEPSRLLLPMCYAVSLGGIVTLVGTSSTLVVDGLMRKQGLAGLGMFEITPLGAAVAGACIVTMGITSRWLLPGRRDPVTALTSDRRQYLVEMIVETGSPVAGRTIVEAGLRSLPGLFLMNVERRGEFLGAVGPDERLEALDRLVFTGVASTIADLRRFAGLAPAPETHYDLSSRQTRLFEVVPSASSPLIGRTIKDANFRRRYEAAVLAVHRAGHRLPFKLGDIEIRPGDTLILEADEGFWSTWADSAEFALISRMQAEPPPRPRKAVPALLILALMVAAVALGAAPMVVAAFVAAALLVLLGVLTPREATRAIDLPVLAVIASSIGLGEALHKTGAAGAVADRLIGLASGHPLALLGGTFLCTVVVTQLITNSAAAGLMFPIVMATAHKAGLDQRPFAIALAIAASSSFLTPIGYQTNLMVYGPGGYRFLDFARLGLPVVAVESAVLLLLAPILWPL